MIHLAASTDRTSSWDLETGTIMQSFGLGFLINMKTLQPHLQFIFPETKDYTQQTILVRTYKVIYSTKKIPPPKKKIYHSLVAFGLYSKLPLLRLNCERFADIFFEPRLAYFWLRPEFGDSNNQRIFRYITLFSTATCAALRFLCVRRCWD